MDNINYFVNDEEYCKDKVMETLVELTLLDIARTHLSSSGIEPAENQIAESVSQSLNVIIDERVNKYKSLLAIYTYTLDKIRYNDYRLSQQGVVEASDRNDARNKDPFYSNFPHPSDFVNDKSMDIKSDKYFSARFN